MGGILREEAAEEEVEGLEVLFEGFVVGGREVDEAAVVGGWEGRGEDGGGGGAAACGEMIFLAGVILEGVIRAVVFVVVGGGIQVCFVAKADVLVGFGDEVDAVAGLDFSVGCRYATAFARAIFIGAVVFEDFGRIVPDGVSGLDFAFDIAQIRLSDHCEVVRSHADIHHIVGHTLRKICAHSTVLCRGMAIGFG